MHLLNYNNNNFFSIFLNINFIKRFISSVILILILFFSWHFGKITFAILTTIVFSRAFYEIYIIYSKNKNNNFIYFSILIIFLTYLLFLYNILSNNLQLIILTVTIASLHDIGGYVFGNIFGTIKITKKLSPKKTLEGFIGSFIFILYGLKIINCFYSISYFLSIMFYIICAILSLFGDLFFSKIKRIFKIKDFDSIIPGHGGILDRIDSIIFLAWFIQYMFIFI